MDIFSYESIEHLNKLISYYQSVSFAAGTTNSRIYELEQIIGGLTKCKFEIARKLAQNKQS